MDDIHVLWERCRSFHGHTCGGLLTGFLAALYASQLLGLHAGSDEGIVCISENDACGVDAIQVALGCTVGRGSLLFHMTGKQAYSFYSRESGKSARLVLAGRVPPLGSMDIASYLEMYRPADFFTVKETRLEVPERARIFASYACERCGEVAGERWMHMQDGHMLCQDCYHDYDRFHV